MKKVIITGATSPVGCKIVAALEHSYNLLLVSRSYGWDLSASKEQEVLLNETKEAFAFINCAYISHLQGLLLSESSAKLNISFGSLITKVCWKDAKRLTSLNYIQNKLFLEYVHKTKPNSALINISSFGSNEVVPNVTEQQILSPVTDILNGVIKLPIALDIHNGTGNLDLSFQ